jgi:hypothetical protein
MEYILLGGLLPMGGEGGGEREWEGEYSVTTVYTYM